MDTPQLQKGDSRSSSSNANEMIFKCYFTPRVPLFLEGRLEKRLERFMVKHIKECEDCSMQRENYQKDILSLRSTIPHKKISYDLQIQIEKELHGYLKNLWSDEHFYASVKTQKMGQAKWWIAFAKIQKLLKKLLWQKESGARIVVMLFVGLLLLIVLLVQ